MTYLKLVVPFLLLLAACEKACQKKDGVSHNSKGGEEIARINGKPLYKQDLDDQHKRTVEQFKKANRPVEADLDKKLRSSVLRKMIDEELFRQKAEELSVTVDRFERVKALEDFQQKAGGKKNFDVYLERQGLTEKYIENMLLTGLLRDKVIDKIGAINPPTEQEIKDHYEANQKLYGMPEMVHARHILIKVSDKDSKEKAELALKKANQVLAEAKAKGANFEDLVNKYSEGPSVKQGGDLGFFPRGRMVKSFEDVAFSAPLKQPVGPVKTDFGYHIIYVEEKTPPKVASLEEVKSRIIDYINHSKKARKSEELLSSLRKSAKIEITDPALKIEDYAPVARVEKTVTETKK